MKKVIIYNYVKRFKNKETIIKWGYVFFVWLILLCVLFVIYDQAYYYRRLLKLVIPTIFYMHLETLVLYLLTPRNLTYKSANILIMIMLSATYVIRLILLPFIYLFDEIIFNTMTILVHLFRLYYVFCIARVYCPPKFIRGYILILLELANTILRIRGVF